jgi:hypothetical protein
MYEKYKCTFRSKIFQNLRDPEARTIKLEADKGWITFICKKTVFVNWKDLGFHRIEFSCISCFESERDIISFPGVKAVNSFIFAKAIHINYAQ